MFAISLFGFHPALPSTRAFSRKCTRNFESVVSPTVDVSDWRFPKVKSTSHRCLSRALDTCEVFKSYDKKQRQINLCIESVSCSARDNRIYVWCDVNSFGNNCRITFCSSRKEIASASMKRNVHTCSFFRFINGNVFEHSWFGTSFLIHAVGDQVKRWREGIRWQQV